MPQPANQCCPVSWLDPCRSALPTPWVSYLRNPLSPRQQQQPLSHYHQHHLGMCPRDGPVTYPQNPRDDGLEPAVGGSSSHSRGWHSCTNSPSLGPLLGPWHVICPPHVQKTAMAVLVLLRLCSGLRPNSRNNIRWEVFYSDYFVLAYLLDRK